MGPGTFLATLHFLNNHKCNPPPAAFPPVRQLPPPPRTRSMCGRKPTLHASICALRIATPAYTSEQRAVRQARPPRMACAASVSTSPPRNRTSVNSRTLQGGAVGA